VDSSERVAAMDAKRRVRRSHPPFLNCHFVAEGKPRFNREDPIGTTDFTDGHGDAAIERFIAVTSPVNCRYGRSATHAFPSVLSV
jgi:hypothetical protein